MKRIVTIQDISCVGKCSLTVALPIISAMGVETAIIPTAVLSTHTAFDDFTFRDLTDEIVPIAEHWNREGIGFDAIYTGYLGSFEQLKIVSDFFDEFKTAENFIFVDPAMGDNGELYKGFTPEFAKEMGKLCGKADIIVPNMTEAAYMLGFDRVEEEYDEDYVKDVLYKLSLLGTKMVVLTSVSYDEESIGVVAYDSVKKEYFTYFDEKIDVKYHGTGDVFASACVGALMNDFSLADSLKIAANYVVECIKDTQADAARNWYGVNFETVIPYLIRTIEKNKTELPPTRARYFSFNEEVSSAKDE